MSCVPVRWKMVALVCFAIASLASASASACGAGFKDCGLTATMTVDGKTHNLSANTTNYTNGHWDLTFSPERFGQFAFNGGSLAAAADPLISFSFGVVNSSDTTQSYSFSLSAPYTGGPYRLAETLFTDTLLHTDVTGTSTVTPTNAGFVQQALVDGVMLAGFGMGTGCTATTTTPCSSPPPNLIVSSIPATAASGTMELTISFDLTGHSNYSGQGELILSPIPEPGSLMLLGSGVVGLAGFIRRKI